jgi:phosphocarrier protein HPr
VIKQKITITNKLGLHARAAAKLVHLASRFASESKLIRDTKVVNSKSIMGVMMLAANKGTEIELQVEGEDEQEAMQALCELINNRFGERE